MPKLTYAGLTIISYETCSSDCKEKKKSNSDGTWCTWQDYIHLLHTHEKATVSTHSNVSEYKSIRYFQKRACMLNLKLLISYIINKPKPDWKHAKTTDISLHRHCCNSPLTEASLTTSLICCDGYGIILHRLAPCRNVFWNPRN